MFTAAIRRQSLLAVAGVTILALAFVPTPSARALAPLATVTPPTVPGGTARLERIWLRQQARHDHLGVMFDHVQERIDLAQGMIDQAKATGNDVTALQAALDGFSDAVQQARPIYDGMQGKVSSHQGFDANGSVTDVTLAANTVRDVHADFLSIRGVLSGPARALRDAVQSFRQANPRTS